MVEVVNILISEKYNYGNYKCGYVFSNSEI